MSNRPKKQKCSTSIERLDICLNVVSPTPLGAGALAEVKRLRVGRLVVLIAPRTPYGIGPEGELPEQILDHLSDYEGARPVRVANGAYDPAQHDVWGALLDSIYLHTRSRDHLPDRIWPIMKKRSRPPWRTSGTRTAASRRLVGEPKNFTSSKLMCWVDADRGAARAHPEDWAIVKRWQAAAKDVHADISENAVGARAAFRRITRPRRLTPRVLLMPLVRFLPPEHQRNPQCGLRYRGGASPGHSRSALPGGADRRRSVGRGGDVRNLLFLARLGLLRDRRVRGVLGSCVRSSCHTPVRFHCTPRRSTRAPAGPWAIPRRHSPPGADQR